VSICHLDGSNAAGSGRALVAVKEQAETDREKRDREIRSLLPMALPNLGRF
jgi:hypothetical protein